jgi:hypothetical protein
LSPIIWGLLIDAVGVNDWTWMNLHWTRYSIFFSGAASVMVLALWTSRLVEEPTAASMEALLREILVQSPQRILLRLWPRG